MKLLFATNFLLLIVASVLAPCDSYAFTLSAEAFGASNPDEVIYPNTIQNGDFSIWQNHNLAPLLGDGRNEWTSWSFDFTPSQRFNSLLILNSLSAAKLTLAMTTHDSWVHTDFVQMDDLDYALAPEIRSFPSSGHGTVEFDLMDYYTDTEILGVLKDHNGIIPMKYADDAIISHARLDLTPVPEPSTLILLTSFLGMMGIRLHWKAA